MENIKNVKPVNVRVEELFNLLFGNEVQNNEHETLIEEADKSKFINRFLLWGSKDLNIDKTFIELLIEYTENYIKENRGTYYRWQCNEDGSNYHLEPLKNGDDPKSSSCESVCHHILLCAEMVKAYLETNENNVDITEVDICFLDKVMESYISLYRLAINGYNKSASFDKSSLYDEETNKLLEKLPTEELVAFRCFCQARLNNKVLRSKEKNVNEVTDAFLTAFNILNKRHERMYQRIVSRFKKASNIESADRKFDIE